MSHLERLVLNLVEGGIEEILVVTEGAGAPVRAELEKRASSRCRLSVVEAAAASADSLPDALLVDAHTFLDPPRIRDLIKGEGGTPVPRPLDLRDPGARSEIKNRLLAGLTKPIDGFLSRHFNRRISTLFSRVLVNFPVSPNLVSILVLISGFVAAGVTAAGHNILGGLLIQFFSIADGVDGEIARLKRLESWRGGVLECLFDVIGEMAVILGMIHFSFAHGGNPLADSAGPFILLSYIFYMLGHMVWFSGLLTRPRPAGAGTAVAHLLERIPLFLSRGDWMGVLALGTCLGYPVAALMIFAAVRTLHALRSLAVFWMRNAAVA